MIITSWSSAWHSGARFVSPATLADRAMHGDEASLDALASGRKVVEQDRPDELVFSVSVAASGAHSEREYFGPGHGAPILDALTSDEDRLAALDAWATCVRVLQEKVSPAR